MPIYEYYCPDCHVIFNFFSRSVNTNKQPNCPRCGRPDIDRQMSRFSISKSRPEGSEDMGEGMDFDEARMEKAMQALASELDGLDENDPRQAAGVMKKLTEAAGVELSPGLREAMKRLENGEDPDQIEADLGDILEDGEPFVLSGKKAVKTTRRPPERDETLYDL
jgi:putative FmdB family regulatory protein